MTIGAQTAAATGRALLVATLAIAVSGRLGGWTAGLSPRNRTIAWGLLLAPFFAPSLLISYAFSKFALSLLASPWGHESLYIGVLTLKLIPVAVIVQRFVPPPLSAEAWQIYRSHGGASPWQRLLFRLRGSGDGPWLAAALVFLIAFSDFELASLWAIRTWTIALFDAQIGGLALTETLRLSIAPLSIALAIIAVVIFRVRHVPSPRTAAPAYKAPWAWGYLITAATIICLVPLGIVAWQAVTGIPSLVENFVLGPEIGASLLFALGSAVLADIGVRIVRQHRPGTLAAGTPGLLGTLTVSLATLTLFQIPGLHRAYDTPLPLVLALATVLLPLGLLLASLRPSLSPSVYLSRQSGNRRLLWEMEWRPHALTVGLLFCWAYFDFTAASILAPTGLTPVFVRLHNLAHYGQTAVLSAMMLAAFAAPILVLLLTGTALHLYARRDGR